ncbi:erythromycin esterase family protein [Nonomuraea insulae]|uniref:Erythromycin esterase family protein n=1 Tax=Nonomuraea insulae TaxID=1616787 RepID=A0ABW1CU80_9ACTN
MSDEVTEWLAGRAIPLDGLDPGSGTADLAPLRDVLDGTPIVGLGEPTHGSAEFFLLRWRITEFLIKDLGFTTLAVEASAAAARAVDAYVRDGTGDARAALAGLGFWTLDTAEMLTVIERLREHNRTADRPVRFAGIDPQHPDAALRALRSCLDGAAAELLAPLDGLTGWRWGPGREPFDERIVQDARRLEDHVAAHGPEEAREPARTVRQFADLATRPFRDADPERTLGFARDRHMAANVSLLAAEPGAKVAVWAHNGHIMKGDYSGRSVTAMGRHLAREHGAAYYALGALFGKGAFRAHRSRFGRFVKGSRPKRFRVPLAKAPRVVEARLAAARPGDYLVDLRGGDRPEPVAEWLAATNHLRGFGAMAGRFTAPFAFMPTVLADEFDGLAFVATATCSEPLHAYQAAGSVT